MKEIRWNRRVCGILLVLCMALGLLAGCGTYGPADGWTPTTDAKNECNRAAVHLLPKGAKYFDAIVTATELTEVPDLEGYTVVKDGTPDLLVRVGTDDLSENYEDDNCYIDFLYNNAEKYIVAYRFSWKDGMEPSADFVSDSEWEAFEEEVLAIDSDIQVEEMTVEAFQEQYQASLPTLSEVPSSYHHVDSVFVKPGEYPLVTQYWVDAQNKESICLQFLIGYAYPAEDQFGYDDQIVDAPSWVHYRGLYSTTFEGQMTSVSIFMEKDRGEAYCKEIVTSLVDS